MDLEYLEGETREVSKRKTAGRGRTNYMYCAPCEVVSASVIIAFESYNEHAGGLNTVSIVG
jgi:biotin-(acetyl-CoA carboxylase) ligase